MQNSLVKRHGCYLYNVGSNPAPSTSSPFNVVRITRLVIDNNHPPMPLNPHLLGTSFTWLQTTDSTAGWTQAPLDEKPSTAVRRILRAPEGTGSPGPSPALNNTTTTTTSTAVVLCILALGEICLHKDRIPDIVPTFGEMHSIGSLNSQPCGSRSSPAFQNNVPSHPKRSRRASFQSSASTSGPRRNIDVTPGLHYLANAIDVIGNQMAGMSIWHVYANILAGLYYGQLGRVMESYWQIHYTCVKVQHLFRKCIVSLWKEQDVKDIRYYLIYWTCMQLECDIVAELNLQQSGIGNYEQSIPHPKLEHIIES
ncbi:hypothetical protein MCOR07_005671 [Pyricularia oryzae]|nr:hypothetical protein MCOR23_008520 [Pyricularia oryzae]KAI6420410.1 hypothetical protein MCOR21_009760 [Pyricularia oryzae]KAI6554715.1 hypothetical protein MCOR03_007186 [Pyricularia oryzae]KAI6599498.1 hypothetical protein MCOR12_005000 [Pyricularia oryzae]KAI6620042.1 hypothetical protein MCOR07_005671 [Pyricularia oryzae]